MSIIPNDKTTVEKEVIKMIQNELDNSNIETMFYSNADLSKIIYVSPAYEKVLGATKESLYENPLSFLDFVLEEDKEKIMNAQYEYLITNQFDMQFRIVDKEGKLHWIHATTRPVFDDNVIVGHITRARDVTKEQEYELKLKSQEVYLNNILNTQNELICRYQKDTTLLYVNKAYCKFMNESEEELKGTKYLRFLPEDQHQVELEWINSLSIKMPEKTKEYKVEIGNHEYVWMKWTDHGVFDDDGSLIEVIGTGVDLTQEKHLIEQLEKQNLELETAQKNANLGVYKVDLVGDTCESSPILNKILEIDDKDIHALTVWEELIHFEDKDRVLRTHNAIIENNISYNIKYRIITAVTKTEKWIYDIGEIVYSNGVPTSVSGTMMDITDLVTLESKVETSYHQLRQSYKDTIKGWAHALSLKDDETEQHSQRVTEWTIELAKYIGYPNEKIEKMEYGALLHDIGKMAIPDAILLKPGKLTEDEFNEIKKHPQYALDMLSEIDYLKDSLDIPFSHHEKWDGSGYPQGLKEKEIPLPARIFAIIDVYDALTSDRPYRKAWTIDKTLEHINKQSGKHFDPAIVKSFMELIKHRKI